MATATPDATGAGGGGVACAETSHSHRLAREYGELEVVGKGAYGRVFLAHHAEFGEVVVKQVDVAMLSADEREEALREARVMASIKHYNIIGYKESWMEDGYLYIAMEYAPGGDLFAALHARLAALAATGEGNTGDTEADQPPFDDDELWALAIQLCQGLGYLHERRILHRDIKPQNVLLDSDSNVKIGDLGLARQLGSQSMATSSVGTPLYFSPELCLDAAYDDKSDVWALGCLLYELATGEPPFVASNQIALAQAIVHDEPAPLPHAFSPELRWLISLMLTKDPSERPSIATLLDTPAVRVRIDKALLYHQVLRLQARLAATEADLATARAAAATAHAAAAAAAAPVAKSPPRVHRELLSPVRTPLAPRQGSEPPPASTSKTPRIRSGHENAATPPSRLVFATPSKKGASSPLASLATKVDASVLFGPELEVGAKRGRELVALFAWERWSASTPPGTGMALLTGSASLDSARNVARSAVWQGRAKQSLSHAVAHPMIVFAPRSGSCRAGSHPEVRHLRTRRRGARAFEELVPQPGLAVATQIGESEFWLLNLTSSAPVSEFILEFVDNNPLDVLLVLKRNEAFLEAVFAATARV
ncbi:NEK protein kinase [Thecamonas trahens ATCC 50062]|uniref:non-specific serine/threonine protein kinase n=1 Tax=Thecamonas trahens ATCC 50062 TaxID=461836 RepID=A0A0L0DJV1_THETB|nr:NEK protein kinase [Thecamonas trahens ATCC 50062]KNC51583.1 NEK protein kinase [Thecamonas trahens ATCC 50062]|eukprot:XP_013755983.1 NEK protein kinase [Thecamonas trahens ATCC 50062]